MAFNAGSFAPDPNVFKGGDLYGDEKLNVKFAPSIRREEENIEPVDDFWQLPFWGKLVDGIAYMGFKRPSKIQGTALPLLLRNPPINFIGQSQSGTGKTAAFLLNILHRIDFTLEYPQALVVAPTRELARQIAFVANSLGGPSITNLDIVVAIPGNVPRGRDAHITAHIVVGTPGTVLDCLRNKKLLTDKMKCFVLDEADNMLDKQGFGDQCLRMKAYMPEGVQYVLMSATFPKSVIDYSEKFACNANVISLQHHELTLSNIKQLIMDCPDEESKYQVLVDMYKVLTIGSSVIFCARRDTADRINERLTEEGHAAATLHSALETAVERDKVMDRFRNGEAKVLITTNVLARGIDVRTTSMVVNYDIPLNKDRTTPDYDTYLHRIGRTGRFGLTGVCVSFVHDFTTWNYINMIQKHWGAPMTVVPVGDIDEVEILVKNAVKKNKQTSKDRTSLMESRHCPYMKRLEK